VQPTWPATFALAAVEDQAAPARPPCRRLEENVMSEATEEFTALMRRVHLGDRNALSHLLNCYEREVRQAAQCLLGRSLRSSLDPADLVQSVHRTLILGIRANKVQVHSRGSLLALALTVARHKAVRAARQVRSRRQQNAAHVDTAGLAEEATRPLPEADPARLVEYQDTLESLCKDLSEVDRQLVELRLQGYSTADVARQLGLNADVLRVRLSRLRRQLRASHNLPEWI
jgi:RNA polymerase sigma-70 factor (ECF subfamily)